MSREQNLEVSRREFVGATTALAAASLAAGSLTASSLAVGAEAAEESVPPRPFLTPAGDFRTVARGNPRPDTLVGEALVEARLTPEQWRLEITVDSTIDPPHTTAPASVERELTLADGTALDLPALWALGERHEVKYIKAMQCLNIDVPLGQGLWEGVPLRDVLRSCGGMSHVRRIYYWGFHNHDPEQVFQSSLSYTQAMETPPGELPAFLAYRLNGEPIPLERGGPVRMIVPWAHGFKSIKWLQHIFLTNDYRPNDTYALANNDPESHLKTAAYLEQGPDQIAAGRDVVLRGQVISGLSGLDRVEYWVRQVPASGAEPLSDDAPELLSATWLSCELESPPNWETTLPPDVVCRDLLGFDSQTGAPRSWPPRYGMAGFRAVIGDLAPGAYEIRARAVDINGFAQPEPRPQLKSGRNAIPVWKLQVV